MPGGAGQAGSNGASFDPVEWFGAESGRRKKGGRGISRSIRGAARPYTEANEEEGLQAAYRRDHRLSCWWKRYLGSPSQQDSLAWGEFLFKFRTPYPLFTWLLDSTRASKRFPDEPECKPGAKPAPLGFKLAASLRYVALGIPVDGLEEGSGLAAHTMQEFFFGRDRQGQGDGGWFS
mmetsp:Transcript_17770/g.49723  ORF Transcript_17770/g.49723 Transcript_17770/m.49723 type:complete len:177 (-) Transcript_17770:17-547(-)